MWNQQRQAARQGGRYVNLDPCPSCGKRKTVHPAHGDLDVPASSPWAGLFICMGCIRREAAGWSAPGKKESRPGGGCQAGSGGSEASEEA